MAYEWPTLRLEGGPTAHKCKIWLNGQELNSVTAVRIEAAVNEGPVKITLKLFAKVEVDVSGDVELQAETLRDARVTIVPTEGDRTWPH